jgi:hypothetical protein
MTRMIGIFYFTFFFFAGKGIIGKLYPDFEEIVTDPGSSLTLDYDSVWTFN